MISQHTPLTSTKLGESGEWTQRHKAAAPRTVRHWQHKVVSGLRHRPSAAPSPPPGKNSIGYEWLGKKQVSMCCHYICILPNSPAPSVENWLECVPVLVHAGQRHSQKTMDGEPGAARC